MAFNHYAKIKRILADYETWIVLRIDEPTSTQKFNGDIVQYNHYYRVCDADRQPIKFCKFQQLDRFSKAMNIPIEALPIIER